MEQSTKDFIGDLVEISMKYGPSAAAGAKLIIGAWQATPGTPAEEIRMLEAASLRLAAIDAGVQKAPTPGQSNEPC